MTAPLDVRALGLRSDGHDGTTPPWVGYAAFVGDTQVGRCAFKAPPANGVVEIAYNTLEGFEGRGVATEMARALLAIAYAEKPRPIVIAQTPSGASSTR